MFFGKAQGQKPHSFLNALAASLLMAISLATGIPSLAAYDIDAQGIPKFVNVNYIDLNKISRISKYRSHVGHVYSDGTQFGLDAVKDATGRIEQCVSMKHYFMTPDSSVNIYAPVSGTVTTVRKEMLADQIEIAADSQPDFHFTIFHVAASPPLVVGDHVTEGQHLGTHTGTETWSDMAVWVQTPKGKHLISYFDTLTDQAFAPFQARGIASRSDLADPKADLTKPVSCAFSDLPEDIVNLTGPVAAQQTVSVETVLSDTMNVGDAPIEIKGTATSGLPVVVVSMTPHVCAVTDNAVAPHRPGICKLAVTQPGNATTFAAPPVNMRTRVLAKGAAAPTQPRLSLVYPPTASGPQSYVRFFNTGTAPGTVTASLINGSTGNVVAKWQSPPIAPGAAPQFGIADLEGAAPSGFTRPATYSLRIEPETTLVGYLQHVIFDFDKEALTDASTCDTGTTTDPSRLMFVHSSRIDYGYPSTLVLNNYGAINLGFGLTLQDAADGTIAGRFYSTTFAPAPIAYGQTVVKESQAETSIQLVLNSADRVKITPTTDHFNMVAENDQYLPADTRLYRHYYQHLVTNLKPGVVADMTTVCALNGKSSATANLELRSGAVFSTLQTSAQSYFRFYNSGTTDGTVTVALYGSTGDQPLGYWTSPVIPAGSMQEYPISKIETELKLWSTDAYKPPALVKQNFYSINIQSDIEGYFQQVLWREPDGVYSNLSTCGEAVTTALAGKTLMGVHSSIRDTTYPSAVVVTNTGTTAMPAILSFYDARNGGGINHYVSAPIPPNGVVTLNVSDMEIGANIKPDPGLKYYVVKLEEPFTGFLQHLVNNRNAGIVTDMTAVCMM